MPNQFDTLGAAGTSLRITGSARMLDNDLRTAYSAQFNASLERDLGKGVTGSISYLGANGIKLYSLNNLNQIGSCLLLQRIDPSFQCSPSALDNTSRLNQTGLTNINRRGNEGLSRYHGMTAELRAQRLGVPGMSLSGATPGRTRLTTQAPSSPTQRSMGSPALSDSATRSTRRLIGPIRPTTSGSASRSPASGSFLLAKA